MFLLPDTVSSRNVTEHLSGLARGILWQGAKVLKGIDLRRTE